jgi:CheY-like chemotaxis protein
LQPLGFEVNTAVNGQEAVDKALAWQPDAIVMDLVMPVKTGFEATQEMRQRPELDGVCIIAASASVLEADQERSRVAGCDAFLPKPIKTESLLAILATNLKLAWVYAGPEGEATVSASLVSPPQAELVVLHQLAQSGRILDVQTHADRLAKVDEAYRPFADRLQELVRGFELEQIKAFVGQFMEGGGRE